MPRAREAPHDVGGERARRHARHVCVRFPQARWACLSLPLHSEQLVGRLECRHRRGRSDRRLRSLIHARDGGRVTGLVHRKGEIHALRSSHPTLQLPHHTHRRHRPPRAHGGRVGRGVLVSVGRTRSHELDVISIARPRYRHRCADAAADQAAREAARPTDALGEVCDSLARDTAREGHAHTSNIRHQASSNRHQAPSIKHQASSIKHQAST